MLYTRFVIGEETPSSTSVFNFSHWAICRSFSVLLMGIIDHMNITLEGEHIKQNEAPTLGSATLPLMLSVYGELERRRLRIYCARKPTLAIFPSDSSMILHSVEPCSNFTS